MLDAWGQRAYEIRLDWGPTGAEALVDHRDVVAVVVDVLSFTTTLNVALDRGIEVLPYRWDDAGAAGYARTHDATLAVARSAAGPGQISLSPGSVRDAVSPTRLVLPSPNGSTIAHHLAGVSDTCLAACLRNAAAVAEWITVNRPGAPVAVIAAGERWPDGGLRPAVEDLWGAGAVIAHLAGHRTCSPEADVARAAHAAITGGEPAALRACASGRELVDRGFGTDVDIAAEVDSSVVVPLLVDGRFTAARRS